MCTKSNNSIPLVGMRAARSQMWIRFKVGIEADESRINDTPNARNQGLLSAPSLCPTPRPCAYAVLGYTQSFQGRRLLRPLLETRTIVRLLGTLFVPRDLCGDVLADISWVLGLFSRFVQLDLIYKRQGYIGGRSRKGHPIERHIQC
jgi:hypothetical protein